MATSRAPGVSVGTIAATSFIFFSATAAHSGPCTTQIAAFEQQIKEPAPNSNVGPTFPQTLGAQLHKQPTPQDVQHAENVAADTVEAELAKAKKADEAGDSRGCDAALTRARQLDNLE